MRTLGLILALVILLPLTCCDKQPPDKRAIAAAWDNFVKANDEHNGAAAAALVSKGTIDHYTKLLKVGLDAPAKQCWELRPTEMAEVLKMRNRFTRTELKSIDGKGYVLIKASRGWATDDDDTWKLTDIQITEGKATAMIYNPEVEAAFAKEKSLGILSRRRTFGPKPEKPPRYPLALVKEVENWKIDETSTHAAQDEEIKSMARETRMSVRDFLMAVEEFNADSDKLSMSIWEPMKK